MSDRSFALIVERTLLGSIASLLPVPFVDDFLLRRSRRALFSSLAAAAKLRVSESVLDVLVRDPDRAILATVGAKLAARTLRAAIPIRVAGRAHDAIDTFTLAILFDHYARVRHAGLDLDERRAERLRACFEETLRDAPFGIRALRAPRAHADTLRARFDALWPDAEQ